MLMSNSCWLKWCFLKFAIKGIYVSGERVYLKHYWLAAVYLFQVRNAFDGLIHYNDNGSCDFSNYLNDLKYEEYISSKFSFINDKKIYKVSTHIVFMLWTESDIILDIQNQQTAPNSLHGNINMISNGTHETLIVLCNY